VVGADLGEPPGAVKQAGARYSHGLGGEFSALNESGGRILVSRRSNSNSVRLEARLIFKPSR